MQFRKVRSIFVCFVVLGSVGPAAHAQWAVVDAPAIVQLIQEVVTMGEQVETARNQLVQAQQEWQSITGTRGMASLLSGTNRNYLPSSWNQVSGALQGPASTGYGGLSGDVQSLIGSNAILSSRQLSALPPAAQQTITASRQWNAMQQSLAHQALANSSSRFAAIQNLIDAISSASDQKAILDLQARISAELGMLQNEQTKLQVMNQSVQAQQVVLLQQAREQVIAGHGRFDSRFQPTP